MNDIHPRRSQPLPGPFEDGWLVQACALTRRLNVLLLPRQVMLAAYGEPVPTELAFAHGVPALSTMSAVTFCQDRRLRRALLQRARVPVPRGATFSVRGLEQAKEFAAQVGFPVVLKEAVGENPARAISDITLPVELEAAFRELRLRSADAASPGRSLELAGYAQTRLGWELDEEGREVSPARTRFLLEKQPQGRVLRVFASGVGLRAAIIRDPSRGTDAWRDVSATTSAELFAAAEAALAAMPGLAAASVDLAVRDETSVPDGGAPVHELNERVRLHTYRHADRELAVRVATALLQLQADGSGIPLQAAEAGPVEVEARIEGLRTPEETADAIGGVAEALLVTAEVNAEDDDTLHAVLSGDAVDVAALTESVMGGFGLSDRATAIDLRPLQAPALSSVAAGAAASDDQDRDDE